MRVHWTKTATNHLVAIHSYLALNSPRYAQKVVDRITLRTAQLVDFPLLGATVPEYDDESVRELLEPPYRIIYHVLPERIDVVAVIHGSRQLPSVLP